MFFLYLITDFKAPSCADHHENYPATDSKQVISTLYLSQIVQRLESPPQLPHTLCIIDSLTTSAVGISLLIIVANENQILHYKLIYLTLESES